MRVVCFSSFTFAYLDRARVLFESVKKWHPDWHTIALITDLPPPGVDLNVHSEHFDEIVYSDSLPIPAFESWAFKHDIVEVCTAVKGPFLRMQLYAADVVIYLDPDICLFGPLECVDDLLEGRANILLTPHQLEPDKESSIVIDNEITSLATGIYNLGFIGVSNRKPGLDFSEWWSDRLIEFCLDEIPRGLFVDQRWCDHVPVFFSGVDIIKDPGYNVASWNLSNRHLSLSDDGLLLINGKKLRFWHFTKLGPIGDVMTRRYARGNPIVHELWNWYKSKVSQHRMESIPDKYWHYGKYDNGTSIPKSHRMLYRNKKEMQDRFPKPRSETGRGSFQEFAEEYIARENSN